MTKDAKNNMRITGKCNEHLQNLKKAPAKFKKRSNLAETLEGVQLTIFGDGQSDGRADRQTDRQTDERRVKTMCVPTLSGGGGHNQNHV